MKLHTLNNFIGGWICGDFDPSIIKTKDFEVAIKVYKAGDVDASHYHKESEEITVIVNGMVTMNNKLYKAGDIILIEKGEVTNFIAISDAITCVIKTPSVKGDKYFA